MLNSCSHDSINMQLYIYTPFIVQDLSVEERASSISSVNTSLLGSIVHFWSKITSFCMFQITIEAMKSDQDEIALQGIEFWSTVCDEEVDLGIELQEVGNDQPDSCLISLCKLDLTLTCRDWL